MGPFFKTSALCLVALWGMQTGADAALTFDVRTASNDVYKAANFARNGKLSVHIEPVEKSDSIIQTLTTELGSNPPQGSDCNSMTLPTYFTKKAFAVKYDETGSEPNYLEIIQGALTAGVNLIKSGYPSQWSTVWADANGANLAYLLWSQSTKIGCVRAVCNNSGASQKAVLYCKMETAPVADQAAFDQDYYKELVARKTTLSEMNEADLNVSAGASSIAVPSVLVASVVAILASIAA